MKIVKSSVFVIILIALSGCANPFSRALQTPEPGQCTMEAKLCSDGSSVGRSGPDCEFAPCPGEDSVCADGSTCAAPADTRCALSPDPGPCKARLPRFHFDPVAGVCRQFDWGGCDGVAPFETLAACEFACLNTTASGTPSLVDCQSGDPGRSGQCVSFLSAITDFDSCLRAGFPLEGEDKELCYSPDGQIHENTGFPIRSGGGEYVAWRRITDAVSGCQVKSVMQTHRQIVSVELKTGGRLVSMEPAIDEIMALAAAAEGKCGAITMATE